MLFDTIAGASVVFVGFLTYLFFFERGLRYSVPKRVLFDEKAVELDWWGTVLSLPDTATDNINLIQSGPDFYDQHLALINAARSTIHIESYILEPGDTFDKFVNALTVKCRDGIKVRIVLDRVGSFRVRRKHLDDIERAGGEVVFYHPIGVHTFRRLNNRSHRNLLIVDGSVALVGGAGIADFWSRKQDHWRDCAVIVRGACVRHLQSVFCENWLETTGEILADNQTFPAHVEGAEGLNSLVVGSSPVAGGSTSARILFQLALASAKSSIDLCSPYFIPDRGIRDVLTAASAQGIRTRVLTSGPYSDHGIARRAGRRRYGALLQSGVELYEYRSHMMHTKALVIDGRITILGSTNVDNRSFNLNDEVNIAIEDDLFASEVLEMFNRDIEDSDRISLKKWSSRSWRERALAGLGIGLERHD